MMFKHVLALLFIVVTAPISFVTGHKIPRPKNLVPQTTIQGANLQGVTVGPTPSGLIPLNGMIGYGITNAGLVGPWLFTPGQHSRLVVATGTANLTPYLGVNDIWPVYIDANIYVPELYQFVFGTCATQGWANCEDVLLHMNVDYRTNGNGGDFWSGIDQFDAYEQPGVGASWGNPVNARNGILTLIGSTYADKTVQAYCPATVPTDPFHLCSGLALNPFQVTDRLLIGQQAPFDTINVNVFVASGQTVTWQYWNGSSFAALTLSNDTTNNGSGSLRQNGIVTFLPPSTWAKHAITTGLSNSPTQSKYWVQVTVSGGGGPTLSRIWGDNLFSPGYLRGWNPSACLSGHINVGTEVEYCGTPGSSSHAKFRQQARQLGYTLPGYNDLWLNPLNVQSSQRAYAYVQAARTAYNLTHGNGFPGENGVMQDDTGGAPYTPNLPMGGWLSSYTELGSTSYHTADLAFLQDFHTLLQSIYNPGGTGPKWWDGINVCQGSPGDTSCLPLTTAVNWELSEGSNDTTNNLGLGLNTGAALWLCTDSSWCPGTATTNNPLGTLQLMQVSDNNQFGILDGFYYQQGPPALSNFHLWPMGSRGPLNAIADYWLVRNTNIMFGYNPAGTQYTDPGDAYYQWITSARTLQGGGTSTSTCQPGGCTITISGQLENSAVCPITGPVLANWCPLRIGGTDVVALSSYTGTTFTTNAGALLSSHSAGSSIEYMVLGHQATGVSGTIAMYGYHVPISDINFGVPDTTNKGDGVWNKPCNKNGTDYWVDKDCIWMHGPAVSGNATACSTCTDSPGMRFCGNGFPNEGLSGAGWCSPLVRRDFTGGPHGSVIVLARLTTQRDNPTASSEYDTLSQTITLPGTYYAVKADGTISATPITTTQLRGGEAGIYVSTP